MDNEDDVQYGTAGASPTAGKPPPHRWDMPPSGPGEYGGLVIDMNNKPPEPPQEGEEGVQYGKPKPTLAQDVGRTVATEGAKGVLVDIPAIPSLPGVAREALREYAVERPMYWLGKQTGRVPEGMPFISQAEREAAKRDETPGEFTDVAGLRVPTGQRIERFWNENAPALAYAPHYDISKYAGSAARFGTGSAALGPLTLGGMASRGAQGVVAGLGSEAAGQFAHKYLPEVEPFARFAGAFAPAAAYSSTKAGVGALRQAIAPTTEHAVNTLMGDLALDLRAAGTKNGSPITLEKFNDLLLKGEPVTFADIAGPRARARLAKYGYGSKEAGELLDQLNQQIAQRANLSRQSLQQSFENRYNLDSTVGGLKRDIEEANRPGITRAYDLARNAPQAQEVWSPILADMFVSDRFKAAAKRVNELSAIDETGTLRPHDFDAPGVAGPNGLIEPRTKPNLAYFDEIKRDLDGQIREALAKDNHAEARQLLRMKNRMVNELDKLVPEYKTARSLAAENFGAANAIDAGYFSMANVNGLKRGQMLENFEKLNDAEKALFRKGAAYYLQEQMSAGGKEPKAVQKMLEQRQHMLSNVFSPAEYSWMVGDAANKALLQNIAQVVANDRGPKGVADVKTMLKAAGSMGAGAAIEAALNLSLFGSTGVVGGIAGAGAYAATRSALSHGERAMATKILSFMAEQDPARISQANVKLGELLAKDPQAVDVLQKLLWFRKGLPGEGLKSAVETGARVAPFANPASPAQTAPQQPPFYVPREQRASGGRIGKLDHMALAAGLIRAAEKAKKGHSTTTEPLLNQPDEAITKALSIANEALE